jgi:hypothetical protein
VTAASGGGFSRQQDASGGYGESAFVDGVPVPVQTFLIDNIRGNTTLSQSDRINSPQPVSQPTPATELIELVRATTHGWTSRSRRNCKPPRCC